MSKITLLEQMKEFTEEHTADLLLPVQMQEDNDTVQPDRAAIVYIPCLPELRSYAQKAPFITHEIVTGQDKVATDPHSGKRLKSSTVVRSCFCIYHRNEQEGKLALLTMMERMRIALLESIVIGKQFQLDLDAGIETLIYPGNPSQTAMSPFYLGEMLTTWKLPIIERKIPYDKEGKDYCGSGYPAER